MDVLHYTDEYFTYMTVASITVGGNQGESGERFSSWCFFHSLCRDFLTKGKEDTDLKKESLINRIFIYTH